MAQGISGMEIKMRGYVSNSIVLIILSIMGAFGTLWRTKNHVHNSQCLTGMEETLEEISFQRDFPLAQDGSYIENQALWGQIRFGRGPHRNMAYSGCEIFAVYNVLLDLTGGDSGRASTLIDLIRYFEGHGAALMGEFGTGPLACKRYFDKNGYETRLLKERNWDKTETLAAWSDALIVTVYNDKRAITAGIHTMAVTLKEGGFCLHNGYCMDARKRIYTVIGPKRTVRELMEAYDAQRQRASAVICVLGIRRR